MGGSGPDLSLASVGGCVTCTPSGCCIGSILPNGPASGARSCWATVVGCWTNLHLTCQVDAGIRAPFSLRVWKLESSLTWNCGDTSPISRLSTRETSRACCGDCPRKTPTRECHFHLWWMAVSVWRSWTNTYARHPNECQCLGLLATLVPVKDSIGVRASLNLRFGMTLIASLAILSAYGQRFGVMVLGHLWCA